MYVDVFEWNVLDELMKGKKVFALDTKNNQVFDLLECSTKNVLMLLDVERKNHNQIIFYYWKEEEEE